MHENKVSVKNPVVTSYAEKLMARQSARATEPVPQFKREDWVSTGEAAKLTGYSRRRIQTLVDEGFFMPPKEVRQRPPMPGKDCGGKIWILRAALRRLPARLK